MKRKELIFFILICIFISIPTCYAESLINQNGIEISDEEYDQFSKVYSYGYIMTMSKEKYDFLKTLDFDNITSDTTYAKIIYNEHLNLTTAKEITEEEYHEYEINLLLDDKTAYANNQVRKTAMAVIHGSYWNHVLLDVAWLGIPSTRSYDVVGFRGENLEFRNGSQTGDQIYYLDGAYHSITYAWNGQRITKADNGFGFAMNIVNDNIGDLQASVECDVAQIGSEPTLYGSYQHAMAEVSLTKALSFEIGTAGLGNVFVYPYSISQKYDGLNGPIIQYD